ncbi:MAG TPA: ABC transporter substrate-binding protein [Anaeromyxobacter sp.]|nr:ABC transporter substrate-binding protein [Anaeromyxobacter sp.]
MTPRLGLALLPPLAALALATPAAAQPNGVTDAEILFGMSAPFSGTEKEFGRQLRIGWELAFAAQNEAGGVNGRKLKLLPMDDGYEPARTQTAMKELLEGRKVFAVVGNFGSATAAVSVPYANEKGVLLYAAYSGANLLRNDPPDRFVFNLRASYAEETAAIVGYLVEVRRIPAWQIAVFAQEDAFGDAGFAGVAKAMRRYKRDPGLVLRVGYKRNTADVDEAVRALKHRAREIKAVVMVATSKAAARFVERVRDAKLDLVFTNVSPGANDLADDLAALGPGYADGVIMTQVVPLPTSRATAILKYQELLHRLAPDERPDFVSLEAYLSARVLVEALQRAGRNLTTDSLIDALEGIHGLDLGIGVPVSFGPSEHQGSHKVWGTVIDGKGNFKPLDLQ